MKSHVTFFKKKVFWPQILHMLDNVFDVSVDRLFFFSFLEEIDIVIYKYKVRLYIYYTNLSKVK